jgi:FAD/FMN-containing dehydrogenase
MGTVENEVASGVESGVESDLRGRLPAGTVAGAGPEYDAARTLWNGAVTTFPACVVRARGAGDVQAALDAAARHGLPLAVRGGGHDGAGRALTDGIVVDLAGLREVRIHPRSRTATFGGGARAGDVAAAAAEHGLAPVTGTVGSVGMAGLTLGGGYGPLSGRFGLALDNLVGAEVVLADGRLVTADADHEPDLFWALRGGGGNFGVVTSMTVRLHPVAEVTAGFVMFPWQQAGAVFAGLGAQLAGAPDELTVQSGVLTGPGGTPVVFLAPTWCGDEDEARPALDALHALGAPLVSRVARMPFLALLALFDEHVRAGRHYAIGTRAVPAFTPAAVAAIVRAGDSMASPFTGIAVHHFHGAPARVPAADTAFGRREPHLVVEMVAAWEPEGGPEGCGPDDGDAHRHWVDDFGAALEPEALPGGYPNLLGPDDQARVDRAYGPNAERLLAVKARYDPGGTFAASGLPARST